MTTTIYFPIDGYEAVCTGGSIELRSADDANLWMTFFDSGVFTVREPGRGHVSRFPLEVARASDVRQKVSYALADFRRAALARKAA